MSIAERVAALNANHLDQSSKLKSTSLSSKLSPSGLRDEYLHESTETRTPPNSMSSKTPPAVPSKRTPIRPPSLPPRQSSNSQYSSIAEVESATAPVSSRAEPAQAAVPTRRQSANTAVIGLSGVVQFNGVAARHPSQSIPSTTIPTSSGNVQRAPPMTPTPRPDVARPPLLPARSSPLQITASKPPLPNRPPMPPKPASVLGMQSPPPIPISSRPSSKPSVLALGFNNRPTIPNEATATTTQSFTGQFLQRFAGGIVPAPPTCAVAHHAIPADLSGKDCLLCRDFSAPDAHAALFPRQSVSTLEQLAHDLTAPFPNLTDKARVIFTWLHYNIAYNTEAFFANNIKPSTPSSTLETGLAVCEGYAALFSDLALHAGLEAMTIGGHGKGYGHSALQPGQAIPAYSASHAWNAVKLEDADGAWKLIDPCWGAGAIDGNQQYIKRLDAKHFTMSTATFGLRHFPGDASQFFLLQPDQPPTWEQYIMNTSHAPMFTSTADVHGLASSLTVPAHGTLDLSAAAMQGPKMRFEVHKICQHWDKVWLTSKGKKQRPFVMRYGPNADTWLAFTIIPGASAWWAVVDIADVRAKCRVGDVLWCAVVDDVDGKDAAGMSANEVLRLKGKKGMKMQYVVGWTVGVI